MLTETAAGKYSNKNSFVHEKNHGYKNYFFRNSFNEKKLLANQLVEAFTMADCPNRYRFLHRINAGKNPKHISYFLLFEVSTY